MKRDFVKKHITYIIALMIFFVMPAIANAQKKCPDGSCPTGFYCSEGKCIKFWKPCPRPRCYYGKTNYNQGSQSVSISFSHDKPGKISVKIFDLTGRLIRALVDKNFEQGVHEFQWDATEVNTGMYIVQLYNGTYRETKKISVVK
jgi:hypothetical protein